MSDADSRGSILRSMTGDTLSTVDTPHALRDDLLTYLFCTSPDRARIIAELLVRNPGLGELLADLEPDDDVRARLEIAMLNGADAAAES